jgi:hypothetical protein
MSACGNTCLHPVLLTCTLTLQELGQLSPGLLQVPLLPLSCIRRRPTPATAAAAAAVAPALARLLLLSVAVSATCSTRAATYMCVVTTPSDTITTTTTTLLGGYNPALIYFDTRQLCMHACRFQGADART